MRSILLYRENEHNYCSKNIHFIETTTDKTLNVPKDYLYYSVRFKNVSTPKLVPNKKAQP